MKMIVISLISICLSGCALFPPHAPNYTKPGATEDQFMKDRYECLKETERPQEYAYRNSVGGEYSSTFRPSCSALASCLATRGYYQSKDGELIVPQGAVIICTR